VVHFIAMWVCTSLWSLKLQSSYRLFQRVCGSWLQDEFPVQCFFCTVLVTCIPGSYEQCKHQKEIIYFISPNCVLHTQSNSTDESIPRKLSILRSGSIVDCDLLLSYLSYPSLTLDAPKKEPLKLSLIEKLVEGISRVGVQGNVPIPWLCSCLKYDQC
jgi:hypothetical protein